MTPDRRSNWRSNLAQPACRRPWQHGTAAHTTETALGPTRRSVRQLHKYLKATTDRCVQDQYGRDVSQPASVWRLP